MRGRHARLASLNLPLFESTPTFMNAARFLQIDLPVALEDSRKPAVIRALRVLGNIARLLCLAAGGFFGAVVFAQAPAPLVSPPEVAARSYVLVDVTAQQVLAAKDMDMPVEPASLTKLMTAYLVFDALKSGKLSLQQRLAVSERAWKMPGSRMFIEPRMQVPVEDLIKGMVVQSGNDATVALAEGVAGSVEGFVDLMNQQARALGLTATSFRNPEGLPAPGHLSTARDLSTLAVRLISDFPDRLGYYAILNYRYPGTPAANDANRNLLLFRDPSVDGLKTGFTEAAGYCLIATARRSYPHLGDASMPGGGTRRLLSVVLGAANEAARASESQKLLNWGFTAFEPIKLFEADQTVVSPSVWKGTSSSARLGSPRPIVVAVPAGQAQRLSTQVVRQDPMIAPFLRGQRMATLEIRLGDRVVADVPLVALEDVEQAGWLGRTWDSIRLWVK